MLLVNDVPIITVIVNGGVAFGLFLFLQYFKFERKRGPRNFKKKKTLLATIHSPALFSLGGMGNQMCVYVCLSLRIIEN